jgi:hypothetical protein
LRQEEGHRHEGHQVSGEVHRSRARAAEEGAGSKLKKNFPQTHTIAMVTASRKLAL